MRYTRSIIGCGSVVVDIFLSVSRFPAAGHKGYIDPRAPLAVKKAGGVCLNALSWASLLKATPCTLLARLPDPETDAHATILQAAIETSGIQAKHIVRSSAYRTPVSYVFTTAPTLGIEPERTIIMDAASTGTITPEFISEYWRNAIKESSIVVTEVSQLRLDAVHKLLTLGREAGAITVLDVDVPPQEANLGDLQELRKILSLTDVVKTSSSAARAVSSLLGEVDLCQRGEPAISALHSLSQTLPTAPKVLIVTDGPRGSNGMLCNGQVSAVPACVSSDTQGSALDSDLQAVDVTGSGDAFTGGCLAWLHSSGCVPTVKDELTEMLRIANVCGAACSLVQHSALPPAVNDNYLDYLCSMDPIMRDFIKRTRK